MLGAKTYGGPLGCMWVWRCHICSCRFLADVLDTKIVDHKGEADVFGGMIPKGRGSIDWGVAKLGNVYIEPIVRNAAGLFQAWHAFADL